MFKSVNKVKKKGILGRTNSIFCWVYMREKGGRKREPRASFDDLQSFVGRNSLGQEPKFIVSTRVTHVHKKTWGFNEDPREEIWRNQSFRA